MAYDGESPFTKIVKGLWSINKCEKWPASPSFRCQRSVSGGQPECSVRGQAHRDRIMFHCIRLPGGYDAFRLRPAFATLEDKTVGLPLRFQTLLTGSPTALGYYTWCHPRPKSLLPTLFDGVCCLACWLLQLNFLGFSPSPGRFSMAQDSETAHLLSIAFITTNLTVFLHGYTHHSAESLLRGGRICLSYQRGLKLAFHALGCASFPLQPCRFSTASAACNSSRVRQFPAAHGRDFLYPHSHRQAPLVISYQGPCPCRPIFLFALMRALEWGRRRHYSPQRPGAAAPARLRARGYRSLNRFGGRSLTSSGVSVLYSGEVAASPVLVSGRRPSLWYWQYKRTSFLCSDVTRGGGTLLTNPGRQRNASL